MDNKKLTIKTELGIASFLNMVNELVDGYFQKSSDGEVQFERYTPHIGLLNAMRLFYNNCVEGDTYDVPHQVKDPLLMESFINDDDFVRLFNEAVEGDGYSRLDFSNAFKNAKQIVDYRNTSAIYAIDEAKNTAIGFLNNLNTILTEMDSDSVANMVSQVFMHERASALTQG